MTEPTKPIETHWFRYITHKIIDTNQDTRPPKTSNIIQWQMTQEGIETPNAPIIAIITNHHENNNIEGISIAHHPTTGWHLSVMLPSMLPINNATHILHNNYLYQIYALAQETFLSPSNLALITSPQQSGKTEWLQQNTTQHSPPNHQSKPTGTASYNKQPYTNSSNGK